MKYVRGIAMPRTARRVMTLLGLRAFRPPEGGAGPILRGGRA